MAAPALTKTRVTSFDVSRGIAITFMVVGHSVVAVSNTELGSHPFWSVFNDVFHTVRMPLFFFLAGVFLIQTLKKFGYRGWVVDKAQYLLYPWLIWSIFPGLLEVVLYQFGVGEPLTVPAVVYGVVWDPRFWYLPALFVSFAVVGGAYALSRGWKWWWAATLGAILVLNVVTYLPWWPPLLHVHPFTVYMLAGVVLHASAKQFASIPRLHALGITAGAGTSFALAVWLLWPTGQVPNMGTIPFTICAILGVITLLAAGRAIDGFAIGRGIERLGTWSLVIYIAHPLPMSAARFVLEKVGVTDYSTLVLIPAVFGVGVPALLGWITDRGHLRWLVTMPGYRRTKNTRLP